MFPLFLCLLLLFLSTPSFGAVIPKELVVCKRNDPNLEECVKDAIEKSLSQLYSGIPSLGIEVLDPLKIDLLVIDKKKGNGAPVDVDLQWEDVVITGVKSAKITSAKVNWDDGYLSFESTFTEPVKMTGNYKVDGVVLILPIKGAGKFQVTLEGFKAHLKIHGHEEERNGDKFFIIDNLAYTFDIQHMSIDYENLFNGDQTLGTSMNDFMNENWKDILQEMTPAIEAAFSSHFKEIAMKFFNQVPMSEIAPS